MYVSFKTPSKSQKRYLLTNLWFLSIIARMNYFIKLPGSIVPDIVSGELKDCDLKIYAYLVSKIGNKQSMYMPVNKMAVELNVNNITIKRSIGRLEKSKYILRRRTWHPTPVLLSGESQGWWSLVGCCLWGGTESDTTEVT